MQNKSAQLHQPSQKICSKRQRGMLMLRSKFKLHQLHMQRHATARQNSKSMQALMRWRGITAPRRGPFRMPRNRPALPPAFLHRSLRRHCRAAGALRRPGWSLGKQDTPGLWSASPQAQQLLHLAAGSLFAIKIAVIARPAHAVRRQFPRAWREVLGLLAQAH